MLFFQLIFQLKLTVDNCTVKFFTPSRDTLDLILNLRGKVISAICLR